MAQHTCKVCRVLADREMSGYDDGLVRQWKGTGDERKGYRRLARWLNVSILGEELARAGLPTLGDEPASKYDRLTGTDEVVAGELRGLLEEQGLPMKALERDFVSYGVVRKHLKRCLGAERERSTPGRWHRDAIEYTTDTALAKVKEAVSAAYNRGDLRAGRGPTVSLTITVRCPACGERRDALSAIEDGAVCSCVAEMARSRSSEE